MKNMLNCCLLMGSFFLLSTQVNAQQTSKQVNQQVQAWLSINSTIRLSDKWGAIADFHVRRNNFVADPSFYFIRFAANYWLKEKVTIAAGYGHLWLAPTKEGWTTFVNENRIYEQLQMSSSIGKTGILQRFRNEQRWQEIMANDKPTGKLKFTDRVRYLLSFNFPVFGAKSKTSLVLADEVALNFGSAVVYNTFDQNRIFIGIKHTMSKSWSYDLGYMNVFQQKPNGYQYDMNHTFRWFFYYTPDFRKKKTAVTHMDDSRDAD